jgi:hypothetical protein
MRAQYLSVVLAALLGSVGHSPAYAQGGDPEAERGIRQAQEGEFETAIVTLQGVLPRLLERKAPVREVARAHLYLGIARLGLNDPLAAQASFVEAIRVDPAMKVGSEEYPPRIVRAFEEARRSLPQAPATAAAPSTAPPSSQPAATPSTPPATPPSASPPKARPATAKKGGSKLPYVLLGVGAVGGGVALAAGGGGGGGGSGTSLTPPTTPVTAPPSPTGNLTLIATFPPAGGTVQLPSDPLAGTPVPEITFDVVYGADVPQAYFEINLWRGPDLCFSSQAAYASRLDSGGVQYQAGTTARFRLNWWTTRQPGCGSSFVTDRLEFFWGRPTASLFVQNLALGWSFKR